MRRNLVLAAAAGAIAAAIMVVARHRGGASTAEWPPERSTLDAHVWPLPAAIDEAADYLSRVNGPDGRFQYRLFSDGRSVSGRDYNILRHAGSIYALGDYRTQTRDAAARAKADATIGRAARYVLSRYVRAVPEHPDLSAVWSDPGEEGGSRQAAKLGGTALTMIGVLRGLDVLTDPHEVESDLATLQSLGRFVLYMEKPNGEFRSKYDRESGFVNDFESLYYPGEAILALTMLYEADHDVRWLDGAARGIAHLVEIRRGTSGTMKKLPNDHWLMIATDRFLPRYGELPSAPMAKEAMLEHAVALGQTMMDEQTDVLERSRDKDVRGAFGIDTRTTPSATRLEGLLALEHAIAGEPARAAFRAQLRRSIGRGVTFLRRAQLQGGTARGAIPAALKASDVPDAGADDGSEGAPEKEVRIDYVQHALSALMRYQTMCAADRTDCLL
jgi:hypothetical protein